jgi:hypothetical protein
MIENPHRKKQATQSLRGMAMLPDKTAFDCLQILLGVKGDIPMRYTNGFPRRPRKESRPEPTEFSPAT